MEEPKEEPATPPTDVPSTNAPDDIDTDELEALLVDLKEAKKRTKAPPKKRVRKPKAVFLEPEPIEEPIKKCPMLWKRLRIQSRLLSRHKNRSASTSGNPTLHPKSRRPPYRRLLWKSPSNEVLRE